MRVAVKSGILAARKMIEMSVPDWKVDQGMLVWRLCSNIVTPGHFIGSAPLGPCLELNMGPWKEGGMASEAAA